MGDNALIVATLIGAAALCWCMVKAHDYVSALLDDDDPNDLD